MTCLFKKKKKKKKLITKTMTVFILLISDVNGTFFVVAVLYILPGRQCINLDRGAFERSLGKCCQPLFVNVAQEHQWVPVIELYMSML